MSPVANPTPSPAPSWEAVAEALTTAPVAVAVLLGPEHRFISANDHYRLLSGRSDLVGREWAQCFPELAGSEVARALDEVHASGQSFSTKSMKLQLYRGGRLEECWFRFGIEPLRNEGGQVSGVVVVGTETTSEVRALAALEGAYRERQKATAELRQVSRAKDEFLAMLVHELRDPLAPIVSALELMKFKRAGDTAQEQSVIRRQVERLTRLLDDLVGASGVAKGRVTLQREPLELGRFVGQLIEQMRPELEDREHELVVDLPQTGLACYVDRARISQAVTNVLCNASRYTPRGGRIEVSVAREGESAVIRVKDNGVGIAHDLMPRIFDLFFQGPQDADRAHGGLGVGLPIARNLVEMHGGSITAHSGGVGAGAEFTITIPLVTRADVEAAAQQRQGPVPASPARRRVMIVDDNVDAGDALGAFLEIEGHDVLVLTNPEDALQHATEYHPEVALLDIGLPGMSGHDLGQRLRLLLGPHCRMIAVTGYGQEMDRKRSAEAGFVEHLIKPVDHDRLLGLIGQ